LIFKGKANRIGADYRQAASQWSQKYFYDNNIKTADGAGLISNVIYRSEFIKESISIGFQNIYTCFAHLSILIHSFKNKTAMVGNIGSYHFFIPNTNLLPENSAGYSKSYFGFVLLGELFEENLKKRFIKDYTNFWNLRHWYIKRRDKIAFQNCIYAENYINKNINFFNFFRSKLFFWYLFTPVLEFLKHKISRDNKDKILKLFKIRF